VGGGGRKREEGENGCLRGGKGSGEVGKVGRGVEGRGGERGGGGVW